MSSRSITRQTVVIVLVAQIVCAVVLASVAILNERRARLHALETQIAGRSDSLLGAIQDAEDPDANILIDPAELRLPRDDMYAVYSDKGRLIGRSAGGPSLPMDGAEGMSRERIDGLLYRVLRRKALRIIDRAENDGVGLRRPVVIVYASSENHVPHEVFEGVGVFLLAIAVVACAAAFTTTMLVRRTLRPILDLAGAAQKVSSTSLQFDSSSAMEVDELRPLATTLSGLIDDLREAFAKEQRFVGDAAHELKTAVAVVRSSVQLLMMRRRTEAEYVAGLQKVLADNDRVEALAFSMLELTRIDQLFMDDSATLDLRKAADHACETMRPIAEAQGVLLVVDAHANVLVRLSAARAETLLTNLLSNAIRHSVAGSVVVVFVTRSVGGVMLTVSDSGSGIRPEALPHVFERFYRDDPSRSRTSGGTGLGLAICKSIVEAAGGSISISSTVGKGTRVTASFSHA